MSALARLAETSVLPVTDVLAWLVIGTFVAGALADWRGRREAARYLTVGAWALFALFWLLLLQHFALVHRSIVESVLIVAGVPACLYTGYHLWHGRDSLLVLSRAVAFMGVIYLPFETSAWAQGVLIETVAGQTFWLVEALGYGDGVHLVQDTTGETELRNTFYFPGSNRASRIVFACTGIGSMAIFGGLIAAVRAPLRRKLAGATLAVSVIWVLNVARNAFIAMANGYQWFAHPALEGPVMFAFGLSDPGRVSFFVADRVIAQGLALVALVLIGWAVSRWLPELLDVAEDLLFLLTGDEYRLRAPAVADGGDAEA